MEEESKNLLPTVDVPDFVDEEEDEEYDVDYKPSPMWDLEKGDFVRTAANNVPMNDGYEAYKIWCVKTPQAALSASTSFGQASELLP